MTRNELNEMTVLQLRKLARENLVVLGAGIDKAGIIEKLSAVICDEAESETPAEAETRAVKESPAGPGRLAQFGRAEIQCPPCLSGALGFRSAFRLAEYDALRSASDP